MWMKTKSKQSGVISVFIPLYSKAGKYLYSFIFILSWLKGALAVSKSTGNFISLMSIFILLGSTLVYILLKRKIPKFSLIDYLTLFISILILLYYIPNVEYYASTYRVFQLLIFNIPLYFIGRILFRYQKDFKIFISFFILTSIPILTMSLFNYFILHSHWYARVGNLTYLRVSFMLVSLIIFFISFGLVSYSSKKRILYFLTASLLIPLFSVLPMRSILISFFIVILILLFYILYVNHEKKMQILFLFLFMAGIDLIIALIFKEHLLNAPLAVRFKQLISGGGISIQTRVLRAHESFINLSLLGHGVAGFECYYGLGKFVHNLFLELLYNYGIFGIIIMVWFLIFLMKSMELLRISLYSRNPYSLFLALVFLLFFFEKLGSSLPETRELFVLSALIYNELSLHHETLREKG